MARVDLTSSNPPLHQTTALYSLEQDLIMLFHQKSSLVGLLVVLFISISVSAAPRNTTVDDHDYNAINYWTDENWGHDPLQGYEAFFVNGTRSFTYVPGASAIFTFTGTGIYLQGPFSNDQAMRQITLDGQDVGIYSAYAVERLPSEGTSAIFWGKGGLADTNHTVAVTHADATDKILVMDAWIFESDSSETQPPNTRTAVEGSVPSTISGPSASTSTSPMSPNIGLIAGLVVAILVLLLCLAGFCFFRRRRQRKQQQKRESNKEKIFPSYRIPTRLSGPVYPASPSAVTKEAIADWRNTNTSAPEYSSGDPDPTATPRSTAALTGAPLPSYPFQRGGRAASDSYNQSAQHHHNDNEGGALGLTNHPLFLPTPAVSSVSSHSLYPTPPPYAGAPMLYFEQHPDPPPRPEYTRQPIVNAPEPPSVLRRLSITIAGVLPTLPSRIGSPESIRRRASVIYDPKSNADLERNGGSPRARDSHFPGGNTPSSCYPPTSPNSLSIPIPLSPMSAVSAGFARQSQNLEILGSAKYGEAYDVDGDTLAATTPGNRSAERVNSRADPFGDEYAFSSYTRQTRDEVFGRSPAGEKQDLP